MATWTAAARQVTRSVRLYTPPSAATSSQDAKLIHRRGFSGAGDSDGSRKVNTRRSKDENYAVFMVCAFGLILHSYVDMYRGDKKDNKEEKKAEEAEEPSE